VSHYEWVSNPELKAVYAEERKKQAAAWRKARKANPAIARLLWRRVRQAEQEFAASIFSGGSSR
jgi:hypothetical protein